MNPSQPHVNIPHSHREWKLSHVHQLMPRDKTSPERWWRHRCYLRPCAFEAGPFETGTSGLMSGEGKPPAAVSPGPAPFFIASLLHPQSLSGLRRLVCARAQREPVPESLGQTVA